MFGGKRVDQEHMEVSFDEYRPPEMPILPIQLKKEHRVQYAPSALRQKLVSTSLPESVIPTTTMDASCILMKNATLKNKPTRHQRKIRQNNTPMISHSSPRSSKSNSILQRAKSPNSSKLILPYRTSIVKRTSIPTTPVQPTAHSPKVGTYKASKRQPEPPHGSSFKSSRHFKNRRVSPLTRKVAKKVAKAFVLRTIKQGLRKAVFKRKAALKRKPHR